ncbi:unnamed protein product [Rodentolepis nana]|uniref:SAC domain-containing protein n=1 Tax=Rodentolepis nana TaxID=102285 RepID=A0A158QGI8_RODNA|nr:unnamed protein product [Rodentolepis nana]
MYIVFSKFCELGDAVGLGSVEGILGKFQCSSSDDSYLLLLNRSDFICYLHDGIEVRRISKITLMPISSSSLPKTFQINKGPQNNTQALSTQDRPQSAKQQALVQAVQNTFKAASGMINFKQKPKGIGKRFENRILEELEKLFEGEADQFYYAKGGADLTLWTQRREARRMRGEFCSWEDLKTFSRTYWRPIWCRYDDCFVWNHLILQDLISPALEFLINSEGLPSSITEPKPPSPTYVDEFEKKEVEESTIHDNKPIIDGIGERAQLTDCLCALESMLIPVISGFVKQDKLTLPIWDVDGRITSEEPDTVTLTIISRRSQYRAGCRYRRRGIDENGHVANYVETEQVLEVPSDFNTHVLSFLQIRGSVPVFWTQTGIKYKPPIQLHRSLSENRDAFRLHIERSLSKFDRLTVVNLVETTPGRQESKITEAYIRQLLLLNNPKVTYVGFDFHEYCKGLRFDNVAVLLDGVKENIRDMKYCWLHKDYFMCKQEGVFRVNCVDCLDRTNLVQSVFATVVLESQLRKLGRLPPEVELPMPLARAVQAVWADNGDALSRHYTGTAAMKGDYTRTGSRTVNGLMKDGVSSMSRYYQRFGEIKRQAAMDFLLGHANSPELRFLRNCSSPDIASQKLPNIEASSLLAAVRSTCLESDEDSFFEFVASTAVVQSRRTEVRAFGILTSRYLHIVRFVDDPLVNSQAHLRIPIQSINHVSLATENALFRQPTPVLHVYFKAPKGASSQHSRPSTRSNPGEWRSSDEASSESRRSIQSPSAVKRSSPFNSAHNYDQYRLDLRQAPFRLFNNYLVPITSADEATDSLRAISEFITALYQSIDPTVNLELTTTPDIRQNSRSVMQRRTALLLPPEYTKPLDKEVRSALSERRDSLRPFLTSLQPNRRNRRSQGNRGGSEQRRSLEPTAGSRLWAFGNPAASQTPSDLSPKSSVKGIRNSLDKLLKQSSALVEIVRPNTAGSAKQVGDTDVRTNGSLNAQRNDYQDRSPTMKMKIIQPVSEVDGRRQKCAEEIPIKVFAAAEPFEDIEDDNDDEASTGSDIEFDRLEQGIDALMVSDIEDVPEGISEPARHTSYAAAVPVEDTYVEQEEDDTSEDRHPVSDTDQTHARPISSLRKVSDDVTAKPSNATSVNDPHITISNKLSSSHLTQRNVTQSSPSQSILSPNPCSGITRISQRRSRPKSVRDDVLLQPRSHSWDGTQVNRHKMVPLKRNISDTLVVCYREVFYPKGDQRDSSRARRLTLKHQLNAHFEDFSIPSINRLLESATPPKITYDLRNVSESEAARLRHLKLHEEHKGHEAMHLEMLLILIFFSFGCQFLLMLWKKYRPKSYHLFTLIAMWIVPICYSVYMLYFRFIAIWFLFSLISGVMVYLSSNPQIATTTPRTVYWWFLLMHKVSYSATLLGYLLVLFCMFIPQIISPTFAFPVGGLILFYGVYFGLIARDFAEVCTDKMAAHISYFSETGIPLRKIDPSVCALCTKVMLNGQGEKKYKLNCTHVFHEFCLRGWCIVGKKDICPYCKEKVNLHKLIKNPWEKPHLLFGNLLDGIRYLVAWQPLIVMAVHTIIWALDLK